MNIVNLNRKYRMNNGTIIHLLAIHIAYSLSTTGLAESTTASLPSLDTAPPWV